MTILIDDALICAGGNPARGSLLVRDGTIAALAWSEADRAALRLQAGETVDAAGCWLMPGLVDGHSHAYGSLLRGTENSLPLELWALYTVLYGRALDGSMLRTAILLGAAERLRAGITGTVDHSPMMHLGADAIAAHEESGLRVAYAPFLHDISDYDLFEITLPPALQEAIGRPPPLDPDAYAGRFAELVQQARAGSGRVQVQLGPNAPQRCSPSAWALWRTLRDRHDVGVHTHLLETSAQASLNRRWPGGLVAAMRREGLLEGHLTCAHGVWLSDAERETLARHGVVVSHNPASNLMLGSGTMSFRSCTRCGLRLALGTDSANTGGRHDLFQIMRLAMMLPRPGDPDYRAWPGAEAVFAAATEGGAAALGLTASSGRIAPGFAADLVLVRSDAAGTVAHEASLGTLVQHAGPEHVVAVMVQGRWLLRDRRICHFDEADVIEQARIAASAIWRRAEPRLPALQAALPEIGAQLIGGCR